MTTLKGIVISLLTKQLSFVSRFQPGRNHDYRLFKNIFSPDKEWFKKFTVRLDLGFLGFAKDYQCQQGILPIKKSKGKELTTEQRDSNKEQASKRIVVEHAIGGLKRYRVLSNRLRRHNLSRYDEVIGVCAGLWNFYLSS